MVLAYFVTGGNKHPNLTIFDLAQRPTVLPCDPYGVHTLFDTAYLIKHQDASWIAHRLDHG